MRVSSSPFRRKETGWPVKTIGEYRVKYNVTKAS